MAPHEIDLVRRNHEGLWMDFHEVKEATVRNHPIAEKVLVLETRPAHLPQERALALGRSNDVKLAKHAVVPLGLHLFYSQVQEKERFVEQRLPALACGSSRGFAAKDDEAMLRARVAWVGMDRS